MSQLIDLDAVTSPDIRLKLAGTEYIVPGELTVEQMLRWIKIQERWIANAQASVAIQAGEDPGEVEPPEGLLIESKAEIVALFQERKPSLTDLPLKPSQIGVVFAALFGRYQEDDGAKPDPTRPTQKRAPKPKS